MVSISMSAIAPMAQTKHSSSLDISDAGTTATAAAASGSQPSGHQSSGSKASGSKLSSQTGRVAPSDCVRLDVLLITGQRKFFDFAPQTSVKEVREVIWSDWPQGASGWHAWRREAIDTGLLTMPPLDSFRLATTADDSVVCPCSPPRPHPRRLGASLPRRWILLPGHVGRQEHRRPSAPPTGTHKGRRRW